MYIRSPLFTHLSGTLWRRITRNRLYLGYSGSMICFQKWAFEMDENLSVACISNKQTLCNGSDTAECSLTGWCSQLAHLLARRPLVPVGSPGIRDSFLNQSASCYPGDILGAASRVQRRSGLGSVPLHLVTELFRCAKPAAIWPGRKRPGGFMESRNAAMVSVKGCAEMKVGQPY